MIYKFRAILDAEEDIFRDIAIESDNSLEDLHNALINAFGFDGTEVGAFYTCANDWSWHEEDGIPLFDTGDIPGEIKTMAEYRLDDLVHEQNTKLVYVYDLFSMWTFFLELDHIGLYSSRILSSHKDLGFQTIFAPVITALLYQLIFGHVMKNQPDILPGVSYAAFLIPGLAMMSMTQNAFANASSSLIQSRLSGNLVFILLPPISIWAFFLAYVGAAIARGLFVGVGDRKSVV